MDKKINLSKDYKDILVYADINMLRAIIRNLISNAIKFSNTNSEIKLQVFEDNLSTIISVIDSGVGIDKAELHKLCKPNFISSKMGTKGEKGTGLGLMLCKEFVEKHGGKIWIHSVENEGTTVSFLLPINTEKQNHN